MTDKDSRARLVADLGAATPPTLVNQYSCCEPGFDRPDGAAIRRANLLAYLEARPHPVLLLVGEAAGYQGCRFSGIAFTSERSLPQIQWTSTRAEGWQEPSATVVHGTLAELGLEDRTILWNVVPFHPADQMTLSNRTPRAKERHAGADWLGRLVAITQPQVVAGIGRHAANALPPGTPYLRHPAHGGAGRFRAGLAVLAHEYGLA